MVFINSATKSLQKIIFPGVMDGFLSEFGKSLMVTAVVDNMIDKIAGVAGTGFFIVFYVIVNHQVIKHFFLEFDTAVATDLTKNILEFLDGRVINFKLVANAPQKCLVHQSLGVMIG